jgi:O-antigen/teichoic acid export membrane protein
MIAAIVTKIVSIASAPFVTRLYTPADYGVLSVYLSAVGILSVVASLSFEQAILLPKDEKEAVAVVWLSILAALGLVLIVGAFAAFFPAAATELMGTRQIEPYLFTVPLGLAGAGIYNVFSCWANRNKEFSAIAKTQMVQVTTGAAVKIGLGIPYFGAIGLLAGQIASASMGWMQLGRPFLAAARRHRESLSPRDLAAAARRYWVFPAVTAPSNVVMVASMLLPAILLARVYGPEVAGWYGLATGMIGMPVEMIANSARRVFSSAFAEALRERHGAARVFRSALKKLALAGLPMVALVAVAAPVAFSVIFGEEWEPAGRYARLLCFYYVGQMLTKPLAASMMLMELRGRQLFWSITRAVIILSIFLGLAREGTDPELVLSIYSVVSFVYYIAILLDCWRLTAGIEERE